MFSFVRIRRCSLRSPYIECGLALTAVAACCVVTGAALRHTASAAFPIDDGYIYSNYVVSAANGHIFTYNPAERSGGITGLGWYLLLTLFYGLVPLQAPLANLAPPSVRFDPALAAQAGHIYLSAYLPGALCLALAAVGIYRLTLLLLEGYGPTSRFAVAAAALAGLVGATDAGMVWGATSGLEVPLSCALGVWTVVLTIRDARAGRMRRSLLMGALLPFARPDMLAVGAACLLWLIGRAAKDGTHRRAWLRAAALYVAALMGGLLVLMAIFSIGWGHPLPSSFYAKVGGLRLGVRALSSVLELLSAQRWLLLGAAALALFGGAFLSLPFGWKSLGNGESIERRRASGLVLLVMVLYTLGIMATLPWFGQEDRYLLPVHPFAIVLLVSLLAVFFGGLFKGHSLARGRIPGGAGVPGLTFAALLLLLSTYLWATQVYAVEVRNIEHGHVAPALWIAHNTLPLSIIASEPIGAVKFFSGRRTVDLVGLTTPQTLGTYRNWPLAWPALRGAGAGYLLFYPEWFDGGKPPAWAEEAVRFSIPDNRIVGAPVIAVYRLDWAKLRSSAIPDFRVNAMPFSPIAGASAMPYSRRVTSLFREK